MLEFLHLQPIAMEQAGDFVWTFYFSVWFFSFSHSWHSKSKFLVWTRKRLSCRKSAKRCHFSFVEPLRKRLYDNKDWFYQLPCFIIKSLYFKSGYVQAILPLFYINGQNFPSLLFYMYSLYGWRNLIHRSCISWLILYIRCLENQIKTRWDCNL